MKYTMNPAGCTTWDEWGIDAWQTILKILESGRWVRNKFHFREACRQARKFSKPALASCGFAQLPLRQRPPEGEEFANLVEGFLKDELLVALEKEWRYPLILKPARGAGSYYCRKVESKDELLEIFDALDERFRSEKKTPQDDVSAGWILEEWFSGLEVDVDGWAKDGDVEWMLVSDNKAVLSHACCETGGVYPSQLPKDLVELLRELTRKVVLACPGLHSAFHFEALINPESKEVMPIELNLRLGGAECPCGVEAVTGIFLPLAAACLALGQPFPWPVHCAPKVKVAASTNEYASHAGIVEACEGSEELYADPDFLGAAFFGTQGATYEPMRGSMSCLCWICAGGGDASEAAENLQRCISLCKLKVQL
ncbi:unnamed protein product [Cladocopium goreaui]|uniref:ATP-grasp domain-containing protein n=1 Tax=Cladocopium goreaui TaxID=2562237 RepID=A0A9P1GCQ8_9DINO|nr:unnamed protein product [Cladocopium goreaui]